MHEVWGAAAVARRVAPQLRPPAGGARGLRGHNAGGKAARRHGSARSGVVLGCHHEGASATRGVREVGPPNARGWAWHRARGARGVFGVARAERACATGARGGAGTRGSLGIENASGARHFRGTRAVRVAAVRGDENSDRGGRRGAGRVGSGRAAWRVGSGRAAGRVGSGRAAGRVGSGRAAGRRRVAIRGLIRRNGRKGWRGRKAPRERRGGAIAGRRGVARSEGRFQRTRVGGWVVTARRKKGWGGGKGVRKNSAVQADGLYS